MFSYWNKRNDFNFILLVETYVKTSLDVHFSKITLIPGSNFHVSLFVISNLLYCLCLGLYYQHSYTYLINLWGIILFYIFCIHRILFYNLLIQFMQILYISVLPNLLCKRYVYSISRRFSLVKIFTTNWVSFFIISCVYPVILYLYLSGNPYVWFYY